MRVLLILPMNVTASPPIHPKEIKLYQQVKRLAQAYFMIRGPQRGYTPSNSFFEAVWKCRSIWEYVGTYGLLNERWGFLNELATTILPADLAAF